MRTDDGAGVPCKDVFMTRPAGCEHGLLHRRHDAASAGRASSLRVLQAQPTRLSALWHRAQVQACPALEPCPAAVCTKIRLDTPRNGLLSTACSPALGALQLRAPFASEGGGTAPSLVRAATIFTLRSVHSQSKETSAQLTESPWVLGLSSPCAWRASRVWQLEG